VKLAVFQKDSLVGLAASDGSAFRGLTEDAPDYPGDLDALIARGASLGEVGAGLLKNAPEVDLEKVTPLPPLRRPGKILCVGLNYHAHVEEFGSSKKAFPEIFARFQSCLVGHKAPVVKPAQSDKVDYEGELAVIIGRRGRSVSKDKALDLVVGYSIFNDVSIRDYQTRVTQWTMGKNFDSTGPFGPWLATPDELPPGGAHLSLVTRLNGQVMQDSNTDLLIYDVPALIEYLSAVMTLEPGDVIVSGTPGGVGMARNPQVFMKAGDTIEVEIERLGALVNPVVA
jgi:2-keto-4-pentenoate hydratase/2-oxohepta-3-ene-1,7-dioic acid hydratase in catechol pathway